MSIYKQPWFTVEAADGAVAIYNWRPQLRVGQVVPNPFFLKETCPQDKAERQLKMVPGRNLLFGVAHIEILFCGVEEFTVWNGDDAYYPGAADVVIVRAAA